MEVLQDSLREMATYLIPVQVAVILGISYLTMGGCEESLPPPPREAVVQGGVPGLLLGTFFQMGGGLLGMAGHLGKRQCTVEQRTWWKTTLNFNLGKV